MKYTPLLSQNQAWRLKATYGDIRDIIVVIIVNFTKQFGSRERYWNLKWNSSHIFNLTVVFKFHS